MPSPVATLFSLSAISGFLGAFLSSPFAGALLFIEITLEMGTVTWKAVLPSIVAATAGFAAFNLISGSFLAGMFTLQAYAFRDIDLVYAMIPGPVGGICGILFIILYRRMRGISQPLEDRPVLLGLIGGPGPGLAGMLFPLTLFMGSDQLQVPPSPVTCTIIMTPGLPFTTGDQEPAPKGSRQGCRGRISRHGLPETNFVKRHRNGPGPWETVIRINFIHADGCSEIGPSSDPPLSRPLSDCS